MFVIQKYLIATVLATNMYHKYFGEFILGALGVAIMFLSNKFLYNTFDWLYDLCVWMGWLTIMAAVLSAWGIINIFGKH